MASEHAIYYRKTLFQWVTYTTLIGYHTHKGLIAKLINTLSEHMLLQTCIDVVVQRLGDATVLGCTSYFLALLMGEKQLSQYMPYLYVYKNQLSKL